MSTNYFDAVTAGVTAGVTNIGNILADAVTQVTQKAAEALRDTGHYRLEDLENAIINIHPYQSKSIMIYVKGIDKFKQSEEAKAKERLQDLFWIESDDGEYSFTPKFEHLDAGDLCAVITHLGDENMGKYVFDDNPKKILSNFEAKDLIEKVLPERYSDAFALYILNNKLAKGYFALVPAVRHLYLKRLSIEVMMQVCNKIERYRFGIEELMIIFHKLRTEGNMQDETHSNMLNCIVFEICKGGHIDKFTVKDLGFIYLNDVSDDVQTIIDTLKRKSRTAADEVKRQDDKMQMLEKKTRDTIDRIQPALDQHRVRSNQPQFGLEHERKSVELMKNDLAQIARELDTDMNGLMRQHKLLIDVNCSAELTRTLQKALINRKKSQVEIERVNSRNEMEERKNKPDGVDVQSNEIGEAQIDIDEWKDHLDNVLKVMKGLRTENKRLLTAKKEEKNELVSRYQEQVEQLQTDHRLETDKLSADNTTMARDVQFLTNEVREQKQQMDEMEAEMAELHQKEKESSNFHAIMRNKMKDMKRMRSENNTLTMENNKMKANYAALNNKLEAMKERHKQQLEAQSESFTRRSDEEHMMMAHKQELMEQKKELFEMQSVAKQQELKRKQEEWYKQQHAEEKHELDRVKGLLTQLDKLAAVDAKEINMLREQLRKEEDRLNRVLDEKQAQHITRKTYKRKEKQKLCNARKAQRDIVLKRQALDPNHFDRWRDPRDLLNWIMGLNGGQYAKHESKLSEYLGKNHISGQYVYQNGIDKQTLMNEWGIKDENDAASLERDILYLKNWKEVYNMLRAHADSRGLRLMKEKRIDKSNIRDVLVLSIGIGEYNLPELGYGPLPGIVNDLRCYKETFANRYGYTFISNDDYDHREKYEDSYYLSDGDLHELLLETRRKLFSSYDQTQLMFDALIVTISSHGVSKGVVCSDGNIITYNEIHAIFADKTLANIPKIYMIDACRDETAYDADDGEVKEDTSRDTFRMTIFADSDGKSVRGGLLSKYMMEAFEGNVAHKQGLYELVKQATKGMDERGEAILKTPDYVHGTMDDVVFVPNMKRGKVRPVGGKTEDDMKSENPVKKQIN
eukprot:289132_1